MSGAGVLHSGANDRMPADRNGADARVPVDLVEVPMLQLDPELDPPDYAHPDDAGADLRVTADLELGPGERQLVGTGVAIALPPGYVGLVHPRSGLAARHGISIVNAPGTVDAGYRGEIRVCLLNTDQRTPVRLSRGDRIAQLVVQRVSRAAFRPVSQLPGSVRGTGGHGSTGGMPATGEGPATGGKQPAAEPDQQRGQQEHSR